MQNNFWNLRRSITGRVALVMGVLLVLTVLVLNYFPKAVVERQMLRANETQLKNTAGSLSALLESSQDLSENSIRAVVSLLRMDPTQRVLVVNMNQRVLYDSLTLGSCIGKQAMLLPVQRVMMSGVTVSRSANLGDAYIFELACPIYRDLPGDRGREMSAVVYLVWRTTGEVEMLSEMQRDMGRLSAVLALFIGLTLTVGSLHLRRRLNKMMTGVRRIGSGDYAYQIDVGRNEDELAEVANAVNDMGRRLGKNEERRRRFLSDASHELKTPLASIQLLTDSIIQSPDMSKEDSQEFLMDISEEIKRLTRITEDLLQLNRMEGSRAVEVQVCDLAATVRRCAELLRVTAINHHITIVNDCKGPLLVRGNRDLLHRVAFNLMENAIKYNRPGGSVTVTGGRKGEWVTMTVEDTGVGIPADAQSKLFERFYRVDKDRSRKVGGSGLGLSIVKECVTAMHGEITLHSEYGSGSTFTVYYHGEESDEDV